MEKHHKQKMEQQAAAAAAAAAAENPENTNNENQPEPEPESSRRQSENAKSEDLPDQPADGASQANSDSERSSGVEEGAEQEDDNDDTESEDDEEEDEEMKALYQKLIGKKVNENGEVIDKKTGTVLGRVVEGKLKRVVGKKVRENGTLVSSKGKLVGRVEPVLPEDSEEESTEEESEESDAEEEQEEVKEQSEAAKPKTDEESSKREIKDDNTKAEEEVTTKDGKEPESEIEDLGVGDGPKDSDEAKKYSRYSSVDENSPEVRKSGKVLDQDDNLVGHVDKSVASKLAGLKVDDSGNVISEDGHIVGKAEMIQKDAPAEEPESEEEEKPFNPNPHIKEDSPEVRKSGKVVDNEDNVVGTVDKEIAAKYAGLKVDPEGNIVNAEGHFVGKATMIKEDEPVEEPAEPEKEKPFNPNPKIKEDSPEVRKSGKIVDKDDNIIGRIDTELAEKFAGLKVDSDGNVVNEEGNLVARAELFHEEEPPQEEKPFNPNPMITEDSPEVKKSGKVVDSEDNVVGTVDKRVASKLAGLKVDEDGNVVDQEGRYVGKAEMIKEEEPEEPKEEKKEFNPNQMVDENSPEVKKSGKVLDSDDNVVGNVDKRIAHKLAGFKVDPDGNIINDEGHIVGKADMIKEEEAEPEEEKPKYPNSSVDDNSPEVKRSGKVVDRNDDVVGKVDERDATKWAGFKVASDGSVIDPEGNMVGKAEMFKEQTEEERKQQAEDDEYRRIADHMSQAIQQSLDKIKPVLKEITDTIDAEEAKSPDDRNEEKLVEKVKPLIEQASGILNEANGAIRGLDPTGQIAKKAQARTNERKALPEEYHLADLLAQLSGEVSNTIDRAKKKVKNMPHAKKALSPLWNILQSPLLQILSAVGLLLTGVLGLVGNILNGLGLGGIINSLLGGIGLNKVLEGFGLGEALKLGGKKK